MKTETDKQRFCDLDNDLKAMCLALYAVENKMGGYNKKYISDTFKKLDSETKLHYVLKCQQMCRIFYNCLPRKEED